MADKTGIQWTDATWNPVRGCSRVSAGCDNCYAMGQAHRSNGPGGAYEGLTTIRRGKVDWSGVARLVPGSLDQPLRWKRPRRIFVNSMSDLFHSSLSNEEIAAVFGVMAAAPQHTFQVLTKRPERMREWFVWVRGAFTNQQRGFMSAPNTARAVLDAAHEFLGKHPALQIAWKAFDERDPWPLPNVWLGVSTEDQKTADERIPILLDTPAAVRFVSAEPLLGPISFESIDNGCTVLAPECWGDCACPTDPGCWRQGGDGNLTRRIDWVIVGGESGPGARPLDIEWVREIVEQCKEAGVACFVKQLGANACVPSVAKWTCPDGKVHRLTKNVPGKVIHYAEVHSNGTWHTWDANGIGGENSSEDSVEGAKLEATLSLQRQHAHPTKGWASHRGMLAHKKGADMDEWPEDLRVRQFPEVRP